MKSQTNGKVETLNPQLAFRYLFTFNYYRNHCRYKRGTKCLHKENDGSCNEEVCPTIEPLQQQPPTIRRVTFDRQER